MKNKFLVLKSLFILCFIVFSCTTSYALQELIISIHKQGGAIIKKGENEGLVGYNTTDYKREEKDGIIKITIRCTSNGINTCPQPASAISSGLTPILHDEITAIVHDAINMGKIAGVFVHEGFSCKWDNGEKNIDEETGIPIYGYKLTIVLEEDRTPEDPTIYVSPNPVQDYLTVHFSMDIDAKMFVKIIDLGGNIRWSSNMCVSGRELQVNNLTTAAFTTGTYFIVCTNNDYMISASFLKQ